MERIDHCPICLANAAGAKPLYQRAADTLFRCAACRSLFSNPRYTAAELPELYRREYYDERASATAGRAVQEGAESLHRAVLASLRRRFPDQLRPGGRVLDFGCGLGHFLAEARKLGLVPRGIEFSELAAAEARDRLGLDIRAGDETALADMPDGAFQLVACQEVVEHLLRPRAVLAALAAKLAPGGVLMLATPNLGCWRYRLKGGRWFNAANPTHLNLIPAAALRRVVAELSLVGIRRMVFWGGRPGFGPVRNLLQYAARLANAGSDLRLIARKPT